MKVCYCAVGIRFEKDDKSAGLADGVICVPATNLYEFQQNIDDRLNFTEYNGCGVHLTHVAYGATENRARQNLAKLGFHGYMKDVSTFFKMSRVTKPNSTVIKINQNAVKR